MPGCDIAFSLAAPDRARIDAFLAALRCPPAGAALDRLLAGCRLHQLPAGVRIRFHQCGCPWSAADDEAWRRIAETGERLGLSGCLLLVTHDGGEPEWEEFGGAPPREDLGFWRGAVPHWQCIPAANGPGMSPDGQALTALRAALDHAVAALWRHYPELQAFRVRVNYDTQLPDHSRLCAADTVFRRQAAAARRRQALDDLQQLLDGFGHPLINPLLDQAEFRAGRDN